MQMRFYSQNQHKAKVTLYEPFIYTLKNAKMFPVTSPVVFIHSKAVAIKNGDGLGVKNKRTLKATKHSNTRRKHLKFPLLILILWSSNSIPIALHLVQFTRFVYCHD
ncbi:CLUMA_CG003561, isoform A [Clunio marinus]|uniref:CLUMA_CG003561, isoform A n=1 Tax=Clunio marinus TaxID=568069 RepID=A0A1J1HNV5_9DIPT|nr:CLUMA_CG003561, isoform A [Clunio marinus]